MYNRNPPKGKVCDFFLQGRCKFGDNCKFEHPRDQSSGNTSTNNRFSALSNQTNSAGRGRADNSKDLPYNLNKDAIILDLKNERPVWPFSAYGPGRDAPRQLFGGYPIEQSPEEMRVMYYLAQASGNPQTAIQAQEELYQRMDQQINKILSDPDGAIRYVIDGDQEHPNRRDLVSSSGQGGFSTNSNVANTKSSFGQPSALSSSATGGSAFGGASFGKPSGAFGGAGTTSTFGQPSQPSTGSAFGQPTTLGAKPAFGQPAQPSSGSAFGRPSNLGGSAFGQPSQAGAASAFGQPSQPGSTSGFGAFSQPSASGQAQPAFGQTSQPNNAFSTPQTAGAFGQPSQPNQSSPFAAAATSNAAPAFGQSPFGAARTQASPFAAGGAPTTAAANPFGNNNTSSSSPFGQGAQPQGQTQTQANTSAVKSPFAPSHTHPPASSAAGAAVAGPTDDTATPTLSAYAQHMNGQLRSWRGSPVTYIDGAPYFSRTGNVRDPHSLERVWFPEGPPARNAYTADGEEMYSKAGPAIEQAYMRCAEQGVFQGGVPLLPPTRAWTRYDI